MKTAPIPFCTGCNKPATEILEYVDVAEEEGMTPDEYVRELEGTYNHNNGHFLCTACYIEAGMPSAPVGHPGWIAP